MSTAREHFQEDLHKRPEQLQQEADDVRADFEHTVDELMNRFSPGEMVNQAVSKFRNSGDSAFVHNLSNQIQNNPIPLILAGISLTWLMASSKQPPARASHTSTSSPSSGTSVSQKAGATKDKLTAATDRAQSSIQGAKEGARDRGHQIADGASELRDRASDASRRTVESARSGFRSARDNYNHLLQEQPLVVGALAIAAGAALGALLPRTPVEDRVMGETSDEQTQGLKQKAEGFKEQAEGKMKENLQPQHADTDSTARREATAGHSDTVMPPTGSPSQSRSVPPNTPSPNAPPAGASGPPGFASKDTSGPKHGNPLGESTASSNHPDANPPNSRR
ncbi:DUF3618 domain-containing protein [Marinobacter fonticola]|uniref:DUF3618 domain-containing protein n=1 Tax=Marinobacter fonticola TaxID=2603215 RepID=UPI0011E70413|nr:DUF3618 domain-containing protein [Marinobacter fonticola]